MPETKEIEIRQKFAERMGGLSVFMITHIGHLMSRLANRELTKAGFSLQIEQLPVLFIAYFAGDGFLSQQEISDLLRKDKSGIQRSIRTLERDGYLRVVADSIDRRKNLIQLTPAGKMVVDKAIETAEVIDRQVTEQLTTAEITSFLNTMQKISAVLND